MAEKNRGGVSWLIRLLLDKKSADQVKKEAQSALGEGTDPTEAKKNVGEVRTAFDRLKGAAVKLAAVLGAMWVVRKVKEYAQAVFDLGAQVNAVDSQFNTVFGTISKGLEESLAGWRAIAGITNTEMRRLLAAAGSMGQGMGMTTQASADFASGVIKLAGDLASFSGGMYTTEAAAQLLQSAIIGNTEAARSLMINFTALDVQARAMEMTGKATADSLTQQEKALAALSVITERAGPQLGDLVRTQKDADNQAKILAATWRQMKEDIAFSLLPVFDALFKTLDDTGAVDKLARAAKALAANMGDLIALTVDFGKALAITAGASGLIAFGRAVKTADLATKGLILTFRAGMAAIGPVGWFFLAVTGLTAAFQKLGAAQRNAREQQDDYLASLGALSKDELNAQIDALGKQARDIQDRIDKESNRVTRKGLERNLEAVRAAGLEAVRLRNEMLREAVTPSAAPPGLTPADIAAAETRVHALWHRLAQWQRAQQGPEAREVPAGMDLERRDRRGAGAPGIVVGRDLSRTEEAFKSLWFNVESASQHAAYEMASAFEDAFNLMRKEGATVGDFLEGIGRGIAGSMLQGLAEFARGKVAENIAAAIEAAAYALGFSSHGNFASASAAWGSAAQHSAAAVAWAAAAGGAGAGRSAVTGGRGAVPPATRDAGLSTAESAGRDGRPVIINIDPFNPANPVHAKAVGNGLALDVRLGGSARRAR